MDCWKDEVVTFTAYLSTTIKCLTTYKQKVVLATMLEGKSMPSNVVANTKSYYFVEKSKCREISPLNAFPLKFRVHDSFYVLCQFFASARFQLIV